MLSAQPRPGSLNIIMERPIKLSSLAGTWLDRNEGRMVWKARINGYDVLLYRWLDCPLSVVEVISDLHLRTALNLNESATVTLDIASDSLDDIEMRERIGWLFLWWGRSKLYYRGNYHDWTVSLQRYFDGKLGAWGVMKVMIKRVINLFSRGIGRLYAKPNADQFGSFVRKVTGEGPVGRLDRLLNLLAYTKTSGSPYSAQQYPAGYHTLTLGDVVVAGQRLPAARLDLLPLSLSGMTVLDIGCNQGGMLFEAQQRGINWGVGVDYDPRMVNAASKAAQYRSVTNLDFFVFDLEKEQLSLLADFLPEAKVDLVFLLSVCMWIKNWREVIEFCSRFAPYMLFESNGSDQQQDGQFDCLKKNFKTVTTLQDTSEDDSGQKKRRLYFCAQ